ncbi:hypothetical protein D3C76_1676940 [compost metagenome]
MRACGQPHQNDRLTAGIGPVPGIVIHDDVDMADARRYFERLGPEYGFNVHVLGAVLNKDCAFTQRARQRRIHNQPGRGLRLIERCNGGRAGNICGTEPA